MSGLSQYQSVFRVVKPDNNINSAQPRATKRNRQSVSCLACRTRKLKCDRQVPCLSCSKRGEPSSCTYSNLGQNRRSRHGGGSRPSAEAQLRLQKLEEMVTSFMQTAGNAESRSNEIPPNSITSVEQRVISLSVHGSSQTFDAFSGGHLDVNGSETNYVGATHWATILENIRDIQGVLNQADESEEIPHFALSHDPEIIVPDATSSLTLTDVCYLLPARAVVDKLLSLYLNGRHSQLPVIHSGKFLREYESFWADPSSVSFLWISILFSALHIGSQIDQYGGREVSASDHTKSLAFMTRAGESLVAGGYHKARPYSVEAVLLYAVCKYMRNEDPDVGAWMIMGIAARLAMRMGYHRDPRHLANISPFEGEMRRRTFYVAEIFDLLFSFRAGPPGIIREDECDTKPPSNLLDSDFDEDCTALPPSRPLTDPTPVLYYCYKCRLGKVFRRVIRHALSLNAASYDNTMQLDGELRKMQTEVPPSLRMKPLGSSFTDQPQMILNRLNTDLLYQRSLCVLHRSYLSHDRANADFDYSRKTCTDAALQILRYQSEMHIACQPGGQLCNEKWMPSSLVLHDYLLAAMIISLDLYESHKKSATVSLEESTSRDEKYNALKLSYDILSSQKSSSRNARRGSNVLAAMLSKVRRPNVPSATGDVIQEMLNMPEASMYTGDIVGIAANPLGSSPGTNVFMTPSQEFLADYPILSDFNPADPLNTMFSETDNIDWGFIDQYLLGRGDLGDTLIDWQLPES